jgi:steroid 5-alpha reductase family enzyme
MGLSETAVLGAAVSLAFFAVVWALSVRVKNYGFLDVAFSYGLLVLLPVYWSVGNAPWERKALFGVAGILWSGRLGTYILRRVVRHHPVEDVRYEKLRASWPGPWRFLIFFEIQALLVVVFSLPFLLSAFNPEARLGWVEVGGVALAFFALGGEALADAQMARFKADPANRGKVCEAGLWRYSRHPNYFFESLVWWGFFLGALGSAHGAWTLVCPLLMTHFLCRVTGIPLTEEYALRSKGEAYRRYQRTTSAFVPWFRKEDTPESKVHEP